MEMVFVDEEVDDDTFAQIKWPECRRHKGRIQVGLNGRHLEVEAKRAPWPLDFSDI